MKKLILVIPFLLFISSAEGALNPAQVYCKALGYEYTIENGQGLCVLPDNTRVDAWKFLQGKVGINYSYCRLNGLEIKTVKNPEVCIRFLLDECAVCVLKNGTEVEVTELMGLSFEETRCGDGVCGFPENFKTCPQDCPSGSYDGYCDEVKDGICDPDCKIRNISFKDPDCSFCGNKICEEGENNLNCPQDCPVCGNGVCEPLENQTSCCKDCGCLFGLKCIENKCLPCGDSKCEVELGENYKTCPHDCPSGSKDDYCDGVADGICDPDCKELKEFDPDCVPSSNLWIYLLIVGGIACLIGLIYYESKRSKQITGYDQNIHIPK